MQIVFVTNYYNHHQAAVAKAFDAQTNHCFTFIETEPMSAERKNMGWSNAVLPTYVKRSYVSEQDRAECQQLIDNADVVIWGSCPFNMIRSRLKAKKLTFCYSERLFKKGFGPVAFGGRAIKYWLKHWRYQKNHYLLCASSYAASDYAKIGLFRNRAYKWGYFPEGEEKRTFDEIIVQKQPATILWAGRMIDWKHPEIVLQIAQRLHQEGIPFEVNMIGDGECMYSIQELRQSLKLEEHVHLLGAMSPDQVRRYMEKSEVFLFTSDQNEGWGAVVNEAMSSACAVVASRAAGAVKYLIDSDKNGLVFDYGDMKGCYKQVALLLSDYALRQRLSEDAFDTMRNEWSAQNAASRFIALAQTLILGQECLFQKGPCSKA